MNIVFFAHPTFLNQQSMQRFARMLTEGMKQRGHTVELWSPQARVLQLPSLPVMRKWLAYIDQYIVFPCEVRARLKNCSSDTLFVLTDNALGPYLPIVANRPHVIHCHDFLAQRSALGEIPENPTSWTGRNYQAYIRRGYSKGKRFIPISQKTKDDLSRMLPAPPLTWEVVYNGLNQPFTPSDPGAARTVLSKKFGIDLSAGYLLHVGGNIWYKNRLGVLEIYEAWRSTDQQNLPLLMIGEAPDAPLLTKQAASTFKADIHFLSGVDDEYVRLAYVGASVFLFPSLAEGFGWPIAEAMASGCPVITTNEAPMTEVAGKAGFLIPRRPNNPASVNDWANEAARVVKTILNLSPEKHKMVVACGLENSERFNPEKTLDRFEQLYQKIAKEDGLNTVQ
ncbi:glycosyltransferase family 4 protein [Spirosoma utsteinense]|uniref:Glycosyltransferase involved in cell wall biosynthesis n=1 Tax=Spirosoma utsteinense TaxID=2585773 RepID=A0ABR6WEX5_9BACT|nr:glycosyltransferase family 1 protein [Spirosoma utsteinense]MBC3788549.1 glycosyltransferase involved in cell wall biosynthesis [Spirosoma utsteinense]MBC3794560.1 glycosyltransferase involved in cell wall biosynthesis [Spirosoma utsteinense]